MVSIRLQKWLITWKLCIPNWKIYKILSISKVVLLMAVDGNLFSSAFFNIFAILKLFRPSMFLLEIGEHFFFIFIFSSWFVSNLTLLIWCILFKLVLKITAKIKILGLNLNLKFVFFLISLVENCDSYVGGRKRPAKESLITYKLFSGQVFCFVVNSKYQHPFIKTCVRQNIQITYNGY